MRIARPLRVGIAGCTIASAGLLLVAAPVSAHVTIAESQVTAGSYAILSVGVPHGCEGSPTTEVSIQIPEGMLSVTPTRNANWTVEKVMETLDEPITGSDGESITERVGEVVYTAITPLPDGYRDVFELSVQIPEDTAGTTMYFPTIQTCEQGETAWIEIPADGEDPHELDAPSPSVAVVAGAEHGGTDDATVDEVAADGGADGSDATATADTAADEAAAADDADGGDGVDALSIVALVVGALGLATGIFALARSRTA